MHIGNKNGFPFVEMTCFLVEVNHFFLISDLQDDRSLMEPGRALQVTFLLEKSKGTERSPLQVINFMSIS